MIIHKRKFNHFNDDKFIMDARKMCISTENTSVNDAANSIESNINGIVNEHAPFKSIRVRPTRKPWVTNTLIKQISNKNRLFKQVAKSKIQWSYYKEQINLVLGQIRSQKIILQSKNYQMQT